MSYEDPHANALTEDELRMLVALYKIEELVEVRPAVHRFRLGDGRILEMWDEGGDYGIFWKIGDDE